MSDTLPRYSPPTAYSTAVPVLTERSALPKAPSSTAEFLTTYMRDFHGFISRAYTALPRASA